MPKVVFGYRKGERLDYRKMEAEERPRSPFRVVDEIDNDEVVVAVSWQGFLVYDISIDIGAAMAAYMRYVSQEGCCGRCIPGKNGTQALADKIDMLRVDPDYDVLTEAIELGESIIATSKCSFAPTSVQIVLSFLKEYPDRLSKNIKSTNMEYYFHRSAPCTAGCPAHIDIPEFMDGVRVKKFLQALKTIRKNLPLAGVCGRICPHPCETVCMRRDIDEPVDIMRVKQSAWNYEVYRYQKPDLPEQVASTGKNCAIIGAGPAGLTAAYYLALAGHKVDIFEARQEAGGMALYGIPEFRLSREHMQYEVNLIRSLGVNIHYNRQLGRELTLDYLKYTYDASLLAIGAWQAQDGRIADIRGIKGVIASGIKFLEDVTNGAIPFTNERVAIIGGGNTAIDCARTAKRLGADVTVIYRRTRDEMPAEKHEIECAIEENINFLFLSAPEKAVSTDGVLTGVECAKMELGEPDESGRRSPQIVPDANFVFECEYLIPAIGQKVEQSSIESKSLELELTKWGTIATDNVFYATSIDGIFAAGDVVTGPDTVVAAIGNARRAALAMDRYVMSGKAYLTPEEHVEKAMYDNKIFEYGEEKAIAPMAPRNVIETIPLDERTSTFNEVEIPFSEAIAQREARRCMRCMRLLMIGVKKKGAKR